MNFDYSDDQKFLKSEARKFLEAQCTSERVRKVLNDDAVTVLDLREADVVDGDDHDLFGQCAGVLDVRPHSQRGGVLIAAEEHGDTGNTYGRGLLGGGV